MKLFLGNSGKKGFTLVEMLVVVAIIGILASTLLVIGTPARNRAKDARIVADVNQARGMAETLYNNDNFDAVSLTQPEIKNLADDATAQGGELKLNLPVSPARTYVFYSKLNIKISGNTNYYCVDSNGVSKFTTTQPISNTNCP